MKKQTTPLDTFQMLDKLRLETDECIQIAKSIIQSAETTSAWRQLQLAKAWFGKCKGFLGDPSPYAPADTVATIPPTNAEQKDFVLTTPSGDHLSDVNMLREKIEGLIDSHSGKTKDDASLLIGFNPYFIGKAVASRLPLQK